MAATLPGALRELERRHHSAWMIGSLGLIWALWVLPLRLYPSQTDNQVFVALLYAGTGLLLGIGRQGIDSLAVRVFVASMAQLAAIPPVCTGFGECLNAYEIGAPVYGMFGLILFGLVAIPINALWNRGVTSLAPEFAWRKLTRLKAWHWVLLAAAAFVFLVTYYVSLGIPAY
jgi:hypothetical protein